MQKSYFPDTGRFPLVESSQVSDLFFEKGQTTELLMVAEGGAVGRLTVTPRRHSLRLTEAGLGDAAGEIFFAGRLDPGALPMAAALGEIVWNGSLFLNRELGSEGLRIQLRMPKVDLMGQIVFEGKPSRLSYQFKQGAKVLVDSKDEEKLRALSGELALVGKMTGLPVPGLDAIRDLPKLLEGFAPQLTCRHGQFAILGRRYDGYVVNLRWSADVQANFLITELGELLRIEGVPNLDIIAESFVPDKLIELEQGVNKP